MSKVCPSCQSEFDDDADVCPHDGEELVIAPGTVGDNPELLDVIQVSPGDATSVVDLEAIEDQLRERAQKKALEDEARERERQRQAEEEAALHQRRQDPDATGTLMVEDLKRKKKAAEEEARRAKLAEEEAAEEEARREATASAEGDENSAEQKPAPEKEKTAAKAPQPKEKTKDEKKKKGSPAIAIAIFVFAIIAAGGLVLGVVFLKGPGKGPMLTVTSIPPGATVLLDGDDVGKAPVQTRVRAGNHIIELSLQGYFAFKEVVSVPKTGLQFLQPLKRDRDQPLTAPSTATDAGIKAGADAGTPRSPPQPNAKSDADVLAETISKLIAEQRFDDAMASIRAFVKLAPDDLRSDRMLEDLANARIAAKTGSLGKRTGRNGKRGQNGRKTPRKGTDTPDSTTSPPRDPNAARAAYQDGERLYRAGQFKDAKLALQRAIQLDSRYSAPHRTLGRIYNRENNTRKTRYHLKRYLALGGTDPDFKVRDWVKAHPAKRGRR